MSEMSMNYVKYLLRLNRADFNSVRRAVNTLLRAGVDFDTASRIILDAHQRRHERSTPYAVAR